MTEAEWLACGDPGVLLARRGRISQRQLMLFGCACCHRHMELLREERCRRAIEAAEEFADGLCPPDVLRNAREFIRYKHQELYWPVEWPSLYPQAAAWLAAFDDPAAERLQAERGAREPFDDMLCAMKDEVSALLACVVARPAAGEAASDADFQTAYDRERAAQCDLLRDILGNPFRPGNFSRQWSTDTVLALARTVYESRDFSAMPILADALQDAGCTDEEVLNHCRDTTQVHVRGCWVVDLVLGKD